LSFNSRTSACDFVEHCYFRLTVGIQTNPRMPLQLPEHLARIVESIETEDRLEVLRLLRATQPKTFSARAVAKELSLSAGVAEAALAMLCGRGYLTVTIANDLFYAYAPVSATLDEALRELFELVAADRESVVSALGRPSAKGAAQTFANAFLVGRNRGGRNDDDG